MRNMLQNCLKYGYPVKGYPVRVWLFTLLITPGFIIPFLMINSEKSASLIEISMLFFSIFIFSFPLSIPSFFLFSLLFKDLQNSSIKPLIKKTILSLCGIIFIGASFFLIGFKNLE